MLGPLPHIPDHVHLQVSLDTSVELKKSSVIHYSIQPSGEPCNVVTSLMPVAKDWKTISDQSQTSRYSCIRVTNIYFVLAMCQDIDPSSLDSRPVFFSHICFNMLIPASFSSIPLLLWFWNVYKFIDTFNSLLHSFGLVNIQLE